MPRAREPEPTAGLFEAGPQQKRIARILDRAVEKRIKAAARSVPKARIRLPGGAGRKAQRSLKAKDTGGRSFHFEHTTVTKGQAYTASKRARNGDSTRGMGTARAHLAYIERETAVEKLQRIEERTDERALDAELLLDGPAPDLARGRGRPSREDLKARAVIEEHETRSDARIQNRLICELPHQSTPEARNAILRDFVKVFDEKEIPYHVAVHAPGAKNDSRNFHAHIVFLERPAKRMIDPATGREEWDFAIAGEHRKKSSNVVLKYPYKRNRDRDLNKQSFVADMRKRFAASVNATMAPIDPSVKFDPRSYEAMGLDVDPISGESLQDKLAAIYALPPELLLKARAAIHLKR